MAGRAGGRGDGDGDDDVDLEWAGDEGPPEWTDEDEDHYQLQRQEEGRRRRRRRRQAWSFLVVVLLVLGAGVAGAGIFQGWWEWPFAGSDPTSRAQPCPEPSVTAAAPDDVRVVVLNATGQKGLAGLVRTELSLRGYTVEGVGNDQTGVEVPESAQVRHGPEQLLAARSLAIQFPGSVLVDDGRGGDVLEVALGLAYAGMTPPEEAAPQLEPVPVESPAGCTPAEPVG